VASSLLAIGLYLARTLSMYLCQDKNVKMTSGNRPRGRPSKRPQDRLFQMRVSEQFLRTVDDWRRYQTDLPSRAEAVRRLVELATKIKNKPDTDR
jgi:hypothetical protein